MAITPKQAYWVDKLLAENDIPVTLRDEIAARRDSDTPKQFSPLMDQLFKTAKKDAKAANVSAVGTYVVGTDVYKVVQSKKGTLYAKKQAGGQGKFTYDAGYIYEIPEGTVSEEDKPKPVLPKPTIPVTPAAANVFYEQYKPPVVKHTSASLAAVAEGVYLIDGTVYKVQKTKGWYPKKVGYKLYPEQGKFFKSYKALLTVAESGASPVTPDDALKFGIAHGICVWGHPLTDALSIKLGIGPECCKTMTGMTQHQLHVKKYGHSFSASGKAPAKSEPAPAMAAATSSVQGTL